MSLLNKRLLNVSYWGWPIFGGGEQFLFDCMKWATNAGMDVYWICFANAEHNNEFSKFNLIQTEYGCIMQIPGGFNIQNVENWIKIINPDIVNHQGMKRLEVTKICSKSKIKNITGVCFWNECIRLNKQTYNKDIMKNIKLHSEHKSFRKIIDYATIIYSASYFVTDVIEKITKIRLNDIVYSSSNKENCKLFDYEKGEQKYVTLINYHILKGGNILLELIKKLPNIPFLCVKTEYLSEKLDNEIEKAIDNRNLLEGTAKCKYINRQDHIKDVLKETKILLVASLVDETFCRTCNEALCNGIPIITTGKGNISYMVGDSAIIVREKNIKGWVNAVKDLYNDDKFYKQMSIKALKQYELCSEEVANKQFINVINKALFDINDKNIMIFVPWCDQGLGIQGRNYVSILEKIGYKTYIFSFKPYLATEENPRFQKNPLEWVHPNVYYSKNNRESVTDDELIKFVKHNNIGKMILPEICYDRVFEITELLNKYSVKTYCVPNIEIVRSDELDRYEVFEKVLCNNHYCEKTLNDNGVFNTRYISHITIDKRLKFKKKKCNEGDKIKFLNLGGLNAIVRKQCYKVCKAFVKAYEKNNNMELTITIQGNQIPEEITKYKEHPAVTIIIEHLPYYEIVKMYHNSHISIQVSKHEGLGLGFYESIITGTPVITLDTPLHNEIILNNINGWTIPCQYEEMKDNNKSLLKSAIFKTDDLTNKMLEISNNYNDMMRIIKNTKKNHDSRFSFEKICELFNMALK